ncbi:MAG: hypothetical protein A3F18_07135 [Legionellales bacterium RIFCSPHIGHO2_12_FULL_37_14]|nr:MAG: hypothetical protein A3F18_07135 [Legionellales bacterium RIFCSPHIGHO2_12_FULL_37_14]
MNHNITQKMFCLWAILGVMVSVILQYAVGLVPCPLCIMQRVCVILLALTASISLFWEGFTNKKLYWILQFFWLFGGFYFVLRQLWLQALPASHLSCMPSLEMLIAYFPLTKILQALFLGGAECAVVSFRFLGLSIAAWSLVYFISTAVFLALVLRQKLHAR